MAICRNCTNRHCSLRGLLQPACPDYRGRWGFVVGVIVLAAMILILAATV